MRNYTNYTDVISKLPLERRLKIEARSSQLITEERTLRDMRKEQKLSQKELSEQMGSKQVYVSRIEKQADMKLSTLQGYVNGLGAELRLIAAFPDGREIMLNARGE